MVLRVITTASIVCTILVFFLSAQLLLHHPDRSAPRAEKKQFADRLAIFLAAEVIGLIGSGLGSVLIVRQAKREYRESSMQLMRTLVERGKDDQTST
jgi:hypothetical protein